MTFAATSGGQGNVTPVCQNCSTSTTPLWRRDESGSVLCNACGLFLKLHGSARPISLKTDVIKSRNRVKTSGLQGHKRKSLYEASLPASQSQNPNQYLAQQAAHRLQSNGHARTSSPLSRTHTPALQHPSNIAPQHMFDALNDHPFNPNMPPRQSSPGSTSSNTDRHPDVPDPYQALLQHNNFLKTRVSELEVINGLYQGHVQHHNQQDHQPAPQADMVSQQDSEASLRELLEQSRQSEEELKLQIQELQREVLELKADERPAKRAKHGSSSEYPEPPTAFT